MSGYTLNLLLTILDLVAPKLQVPKPFTIYIFHHECHDWKLLHPNIYNSKGSMRNTKSTENVHGWSTRGWSANLKNGPNVIWTYKFKPN